MKASIQFRLYLGQLFLELEMFQICRACEDIFYAQKLFQ
jgi:hypothetical protein